ncbi:MAG: hypothetical protein R6U94_11465, partial [Nitriliruptoraceae bacterium]
FLWRGRFEIGEWYRWIRLFLGVAAVWHLLAALEIAFGPFMISREPALPSILLTSSLFNVFWAVVILVPGIRILTREDGDEDTCPLPHPGSR